MTFYIPGIHEPDQSAAPLFGDKPGTVVFTEAIGSNPNDKSGNDYRWWADRGYRVIVRLNNGYYSAGNPVGTIPSPSLYESFAERCRAFVAASQGCWEWIIGNEPNHLIERPQGAEIKATDYARCFAMCRRAIKQAQPNARVILAAIAPWNQSSGDWLNYQRAVYISVAANAEGDDVGADGFALHAYTHGPEPSLLSSNETNSNGWLWHFRTYRDQLQQVPASMRLLPVDITETNQGDNAWVDLNSGWVQAAMRETDAWNQTPGTQKIYSVSLYRWPEYDQKYTIANKHGVQDDFREACRMGLVAPQGVVVNMPNNQSNTVFMPKISNSTDGSVPAALPQRDIDPRLIARGTKIVDGVPAADGTLWQLVKAQFLPVGTGSGQAGGRTEVFVEAVDENGAPVSGVPFRLVWSTGSSPIITNGKFGFDAANGLFSKGRNAFNVTGDHADTVNGIGMGQDDPGGWNAGEHTSTLLRYQRVVAAAQQPSVPAQPAPNGPTATPDTPAGANVRSGPNTSFPALGAVPTGQPMPVTGMTINGSGAWYQVQSPYGVGWVSFMVVSVANVSGVPSLNVPDQPPTPAEPAPDQPSESTGDKWQRTIEWILNEEGGYTANDEGAPANFGINQAANPDLDVAHITRDQAIERYRTKYYIGSGADRLDWPFCLLAMNAAVQFGESEAAELIEESDNNPLRFQGLCQLYYSKINQDSWDRNGKAWMARAGKVLIEASKP